MSPLVAVDELIHNLSVVRQLELLRHATHSVVITIIHPEIGCRVSPFSYKQHGSAKRITSILVLVNYQANSSSVKSSLRNTTTSTYSTPRKQSFPWRTQSSHYALRQQQRSIMRRVLVSPRPTEGSEKSTWEFIWIKKRIQSAGGRVEFS